MGTEAPKFNVCLVGSGGVGTIGSVVLEKSGRAKVTAVLRSKYEAVRERGWDIESVDHGVLKGWRPSRGRHSQQASEHLRCGGLYSRSRRALDLPIA